MSYTFQAGFTLTMQLRVTMSFWSCFVSPQCWDYNITASHCPNHAASPSQAFLDFRWARLTKTHSLKDNKERQQEARSSTPHQIPMDIVHCKECFPQMLPLSSPRNNFKQNRRTLKCLETFNSKCIATELPQDFTSHLQYWKWSYEWTDLHDRVMVKPMALGATLNNQTEKKNVLKSTLIPPSFAAIEGPTDTHLINWKGRKGLPEIGHVCSKRLENRHRCGFSFSKASRASEALEGSLLPRSLLKSLLCPLPAWYSTYWLSSWSQDTVLPSGLLCL